MSRERLSTEPWEFRVKEPRELRETAPEYDHLAETQFKDSDKAFARELATKISKGATVVDIGGGSGIQAIYLLLERDDIEKLILVDGDPEMLAIARKKAEEAGVLDRLETRECDMTQMAGQEWAPKGGAYVYSNTALHELDDDKALGDTIHGIAEMVGEDGGCYLRDLVLASNAVEAQSWRAEVVNDEDLSPRELQLFAQSQRAAFDVGTFSLAVDGTSLRNRPGDLRQLPTSQLRYLAYEVDDPRLPVTQK